ncbi:ADP-ribosylation factor GTPase-activating protein AGD5 isoform X2 [Spinacia oleracea]|uniref:ADP-ribosylation factor GTPase-activating protein AGD5 isoform X2 n=1 Tax=Spinacia oleracea TaxID=3562 RepID=A0A9R0JJV9_SPIOL|nr:ADP-ribosylation factor GTPase-activating protein AGD5-like isoform X2 [Spinacia oleracea]
MFWRRKRSAMNPKSPVSKVPIDKHIKILEELLKLPENKECADCRSKAPRWASINLGIFICLQCSGIHRSLGVHISKVRSTTLDTWLPEQVAFMQSMGNRKSNAYWEAELPLHYDSNRIENFTQAKYVEKRWIPRDCKVKPPASSTPARLPSSRSTRRYGGIAEWTNNQHLCKSRNDSSTAERDRESSSPSSVEDCKIERQHQQQDNKKENCQPSMNQSHSVLKCANGKPSKEPAQVVPRILPNGNLWKSEQESLKIKSSTANSMTAVPSSDVDYASEHLITLCMDDSFDDDSSSGTSAWVHFDSDEELSTSEATIVPKLAVESASIHEAKFALKSSASKPNMVSSPSIHLQRLAMLAEGVYSTDAPKSAGGIHHQLNTKGGSVERTIGTQMPIQNFQPGKFESSSARYTMPSSYAPAILMKSASTTPARRPPAALPVSGYDYDFSFLTQGMFRK